MVPAAARNTVHGATDICRENRHVEASVFLAWDPCVPYNPVGRGLDHRHTESELLGSEAAQLDGFTQTDGTNVFALELKPSVPAANGPREVVILVDTSASQTGDYRDKSLATLQATLQTLSPDDRVKLVAFDMDAVPLTQGFVAPGARRWTRRVRRWSSARRWAPATWKRRWTQR